MLALLLCLAVIAATCIYKFFKNVAELNRKLECFVCPPQNLLLGHASEFTSTKSIIPGLRKYQLEYGGLVRLNVGFCFPFVLVTDVKFLEFLLSSTRLIEKSMDYKFLYKWLGTGLLTSHAQKWVQTRKIITPAFHFQILEQFIDVFNTSSDVLIHKLSKQTGKNIDIYSFLTLYTLDVICETSMGTTVNAQINEGSVYVQSVKEMGRIIAERGFDPMQQTPYTYFLTKNYWTERSAVKTINDYTMSVIRNRKKAQSEVKKDDCDDVGRKKRLAFLDLLLHSTLDGKPMGDDDIRQEVNTFMFAGHDTTGSALSFIMYCLSHNPDVQEKVVQELHDIYLDDKFRAVTYKDLQEMKYLEMVIKEALRLYPPAALFGREMLQDEPFYGGILPQDVPLGIFTYGLHRDPVTFPDPEKFDPERFTLENQAKRNPFSYIPFSAGARNCIGQKFAMMEMKATIAKLLRKFEVLPVPEHKMKLVFEMVLKSSNGVYVKLNDRQF